MVQGIGMRPNMRAILILLGMVSVLLPGGSAFWGVNPSPARAADLIFTGKLVCSLKRPAILPFPAEILSIEVNPGQKVRAGQVLARYRLNPEAVQSLNRRLAAPQIAEIQAKLAEVDKALSLLEVKEQGLRELSRQNLAAPQAVNQVEQEKRALIRQKSALSERLKQERRFSQEDLALLHQQLGVAPKGGRVPEVGALMAPIDGHVVWMHPDLKVGMELKGGTVAFQVGIMDPMLLKARVFEAEALRLKEGETVNINVDSLPGRTFKARVSHLPWSPTALSLEQPTYYEVEFQVSNPDLVLREGLKATLVLKSEEQPPPGPLGK
uniref:HlyD family efflux transporter periplasmic adaptor subunit n=1 Tax=Desulfobacca acetoxidans TaxID=60893 RepID=A0A7V6A4N6_9BACT